MYSILQVVISPRKQTPGIFIMTLLQTRHTRKDEEFMRLAAKLAQKGKGKTSPNPMVGAVVVKKGKILAQGYHRKFGGPHAEAVAIKACGEEARGATLYTTLEPCCHFGKTPPCTDLIIQRGIKKVVCAMIDPNPKVNGKGIRRLRKQGIKVSVGVLGEEARRLNEIHFKYMTTGLPFVTLMLAQTLDGRILPKAGSGITLSRRMYTEYIQSEKPRVNAVLFETNSTRVEFAKALLASSNSTRPRLILLGSWREISDTIKKLKGRLRENVTCVLTDEVSSKENVEIWKIKTRKTGEINLLSLVKKAGKDGVTDLLVEAGNRLATGLLRHRLVDKILYFISPEIRGQGEESFGDLGVSRIRDATNLEDCEFKQLKHGLLVVGYPAGAGR
jgi:diaminohydroxyphosphoribosylaminopyrimidine deaminase/5-amino-6-(5-phosphoribosylamino)uracil reductase